MAAFWHKFFSIIKVGFLLKTLFLIMIIFLCYAIGFLLAVLADVFYLKDEKVILASPQSSINIPTDKGSALIKNYANLVLNNMLGTEEAPPGLVLDEETLQTTTNLDLITLIGTLIWTNRSLAILMLDNEIRIILEGDKIPDSEITLSEVRRDKVQVTLAGLDRWIDLQASKDGLKEAQAASSQSATNKQPKPVIKPSQTVASGGIKLENIQGEHQNVFVSQDRLEHELKNFAQFLNQARVFPHFDNGQATGYVIKNIISGSVYEQLGLQNNDIIKTVNGQLIDSPEKAFELFKLLRNEKLVQLSLDRKGEPLNIDFHIN